MTELYTVSLFFRSGQKLDLFFQSKAKGQLMFQSFIGDDAGPQPFGDDYGTEIIRADSSDSVIAAVMFQDAGRASEASIEVSLLQARNQVRAQERARHDPMINKAQVQAPIVLPSTYGTRN